MRTLRRAAVRSVTLLIVGGVSHASLARPLDTETCHSLATEHRAFVANGIEQHLAQGTAHGAGWTLAHMTLEQVARIKRFLAVEDEIMFRCTGVDLSAVPAPQPTTLKTGPVVPLPLRRPVPQQQLGNVAHTPTAN